MDIPVIDPLMGQEFVSLTTRCVPHGCGGRLTNTVATVTLNAKQLSHRHGTQFWIRDSTPPSSVDLEWEHEGNEFHRNMASSSAVEVPGRVEA